MKPTWKYDSANPYGLVNTILISIVDGFTRWYRKSQYQKNNRGDYERKSD